MYIKRAKWSLLIAIILTVVITLTCTIIAYHTAIHDATTSEGWVDYREDGTPIFVLEVNGNYYEWFIDEE